MKRSNPPPWVAEVRYYLASQTRVENEMSLREVSGSACFWVRLVVRQVESGILLLFFSVDLGLRHNFDNNKNNSDSIHKS